VRSGAFDASQILAVTFTDKAAGELRRRLQTLDVAGVEARTFHSAALSQLSRLWSSHTGEPLPEVLDHKAPLIASLANALPPPHKFLPRRELANEIEWAKNRMITPARYLAELGDHDPPIPAELMARVYEGYERRKRATGRLDFEDMLGLAAATLDEHPDAAETVRSRFSAFTVDEFQDVNPLQAGLLERWLGPRDDLCVVGDDYQTIYGFTGASPEHLLSFTQRFPHATVIRLEENYRSTPEVLEPREPTVDAPRGDAEDASIEQVLRTSSGRACRAERERRGRCGRRGGASSREGRGRPARGDRGALPDQRAVRAVRGGLRRRRDPVSGA
jgi:DNA helicase-2/ATP-dependent DNA helicase PcrA